jgi:hypothetical protein
MNETNSRILKGKTYEPRWQSLLPQASPKDHASLLFALGAPRGPIQEVCSRRSGMVRVQLVGAEIAIARARIAALLEQEEPLHPDPHYLESSSLHNLTLHHREKVVKYINEVRGPLRNATHTRVPPPRLGPCSGRRPAPRSPVHARADERSSPPHVCSSRRTLA